MADKRVGAFSDLLDSMLKLISRTWATSLILGGVLFVAPSVFFGWAYGTLLDALLRIADFSASRPGPMLEALGVGYLWIVLAGIAQGLVFLFVRACVTEHTARAARGRSADTFAIVVDVITRRFAPLLGQRLLQVVILSITFGAAMLFACAGIALGAALQAIWLAIVLGTAFTLAGTAVVVWLSVRYAVTLESLVIDGTGVEQSLDASMALVEHRWWRIFGYTLLFGLMVSFASSLIATPIMFFSTIRQFVHSLETLMRETSRSQSVNRMFLQLLAGLGRRIGIYQYVQSLLAGLVTPVFMTLLFLDLKGASEPAGDATPRAHAAPPGAVS